MSLLALLLLTAGRLDSCKGKNDMATPAPGTREFVQTTVGNLGRCRVGVGSVQKDAARVVVWHEGQHIENAQILSRGGLLLGCGALYRVVDIVLRPGNTSLPGGSKNVVVIEEAAVTIPGLSFTPDSWVLVKGGTLFLGPQRDDHLADLSLTSHGETPRATFTIRHGGGDKATVEVGAGDVVAIGGEQHRVLQVVLPDPARGVSGWVEVDSKVK
jgi:hypothetical protein